jgi:hypothetical protein
MKISSRLDNIFKKTIADIQLLKVLKFIDDLATSGSVEIDVNKFFNKYQLDD